MGTSNNSSVWHPLTQHQTAADPISIQASQGLYLVDEEGNKYIDAIASWYTCIYGHNHPHLVAAIQKQVKHLDFTMLTGLTHTPAKQLADQLVKIVPGNLKKVFFNDNGSTAIEAAIKMALQFHYNKGEKRDTLIAFEDGFHGDTFGAMSASGLAVYKGPFSDFTLKVLRLPTPKEENLQEVLSLLKTYFSEHACAAFVYEPLVQGAAGMKFHNAEGLDGILKLCQSQKVICIADEIMTGFGKTGKNFASEYVPTPPNIMCLSKALTGGMFPMSVTITSEEVYEAFLDEKVSKAFMHAHTYSGHPLGCAVALAGIELLLSDTIQNQILSISKTHNEFVEELQGHPKIKDIRSLGVILAIDLKTEMDRYGKLRNQLYRFFLKKGVLLRPLGNTIYIIPPFIISKKELEIIYQSMRSCLDEY